MAYPIQELLQIRKLLAHGRDLATAGGAWGAVQKVGTYRLLLRGSGVDVGATGEYTRKTARRAQGKGLANSVPQSTSAQFVVYTMDEVDPNRTQEML